MKEEQPKVSDSTRIRYTNTAYGILHRYRKDTQTEWKEDLDKFVDWIFDLLADKQPPTRRQYRCALREVLQNDAPPWFFAKLDAIHTMASPAPKKKNRTRKSIKEKDLLKLQRKAVECGSKWARIGVSWLTVCMLVGVRPSELWGAQLLDGKLKVPNGKYTEGGQRSFGSHRTLHLRLDEAEIEIIEKFLETVPQEETLEHAQKIAQQALRRLQMRLWPKRKTFYALYSGRHQCVADAKASGLTLIEIAALAGHAATKTAQVHYGRRTAGRASGGAFRVMPSESDIRAVAEINGVSLQEEPAGNTSPRG